MVQGERFRQKEELLRQLYTQEAQVRETKAKLEAMAIEDANQVGYFIYDKRIKGGTKSVYLKGYMKPEPTGQIKVVFIEGNDRPDAPVICVPSSCLVTQEQWHQARIQDLQTQLADQAARV
jgi:hypothetical protein